jgi:hypothetical protein
MSSSVVNRSTAEKLAKLYDSSGNADKAAEWREKVPLHVHIKFTVPGSTVGVD